MVGEGEGGRNPRRGGWYMYGVEYGYIPSCCTKSAASLTLAARLDGLS